MFRPNIESQAFLFACVLFIISQENYFSQREESDLDIELPEDCADGTYLQTL